jgi:hypothetical protein
MRPYLIPHLHIRALDVEIPHIRGRLVQPFGSLPAVWSQHIPFFCLPAQRPGSAVKPFRNAFFYRIE